MAKAPRCCIQTWAGSTRCPPTDSRSSGWGSPSPCPAKETASTTRRPKTSSRWSRPSFTTIGGGRRPRYLREGFGEVHRLVQQRAHQEAPGRKQPGRVQAQPGRLIHFFCRSGNGVLCRCWTQNEDSFWVYFALGADRGRRLVAGTTDLFGVGNALSPRLTLFLNAVRRIQ